MNTKIVNALSAIAILTAFPTCACGMPGARGDHFAHITQEEHLATADDVFLDASQQKQAPVYN